MLVIIKTDGRTIEKKQTIIILYVVVSKEKKTVPYVFEKTLKFHSSIDDRTELPVQE